MFWSTQPATMEKQKRRTKTAAWWTFTEGKGREGQRMAICQWAPPAADENTRPWLLAKTPSLPLCSPCLSCRPYRWLFARPGPCVLCTWAAPSLCAPMETIQGASLGSQQLDEAHAASRAGRWCGVAKRRGRGRSLGPGSAAPAGIARVLGTAYFCSNLIWPCLRGGQGADSHPAALNMRQCNS